MNNEVKVVVIEHLNRTLKSKMWRYFTAYNTYCYVDVLQAFIDAYNATYHRTIKTAPIAVTLHKSLAVWKNVYGNRYTAKVKKSHLKKGDHVRVSKLKRVFTKGYQQTFSNKILIQNRSFSVIQYITFITEIIFSQKLKGDLQAGCSIKPLI